MTSSEKNKIFPITLLGALIVFSLTVSLSSSSVFAQTNDESNSGGNQALAQNSKHGNNEANHKTIQRSDSSQSSSCISRGNTEGSCNNLSFQLNQNGQCDSSSSLLCIPQREAIQSNSPDVSSPLNAASVSCGEVIKQSVKLSSNLDCKTDGIIVGADDLTVDLNGYTITGPGQSTSKVGLMLGDFDNVKVVGPGIIKDFQAGILNTGGKGNMISDITLTQNQIGSFNTGAKNTQINDNLFLSNGIGLASQSSMGSKLNTNLFKSNDLAGITFVNSENNDVTMNTIQGAISGIFIDGQSSNNNINSNNILQNKGLDVNNANGLPLNINNNNFNDNNCMTSAPEGLCLGR